MTTKSRAFPIGHGVNCELERLISTRLLVQANSGGGKSWALRRLLEQTHGRVQQIVIDPEGEFASLRERFDYVLAARQGGDTLADPRAAKLLAERLLELGVSAILDIYELQPGERVRFVRLFLEALVDAPKTLWHPALVVVDEAHVYCPEKGHGEAESSEAVKALCTRGRKRGFCAVLATQRLSKLHKDAAAECNNKLIGRTSLDVDMKRAAEELGFTTKEERLSLRDLEDGQFYAFGPAIARAVSKVTVGSVQTTHPKAGSHLAAVVPPPTEKVKALLPKLSDLPAEAEARERTVKDLKAEIVTLKRENAQLQKAQPPAPKTETKRVEVLTDADRALLGKWQAAITESQASSVAILTDANARVDRVVQKAVAEYLQTIRTVSVEQAQLLEQMFDRVGIRKILEKLPAAGAAALPPGRPARAELRGGVPPPPRPTHDRAVRHEPSTLPEGQRVILTAIAQRQDGATREQLTVLTGYARSSRDTYLQKLGQAGYTRPMNGSIVATDAGIAALGTFEPLPTGAALLDHWRRELPEGERRILDVVVSAYPHSVERTVIDESTGYARSSRDTYLQKLSARRLVDADRGSVRASSELFD